MFTEWIFALRDIYRIKSSPNNAIWFKKTNFLEAIKFFRLSIAAIFYPLRALKTRGVLRNFWYGEAPPWGPTPYPFIYHFSRKRYPFRIPSIDKWYPFHIPSIDKWYPFHIPCLEFCIPFNCCKCIVIEIGINQKNRTFSRLNKAIKFICSSL